MEVGGGGSCGGHRLRKGPPNPQSLGKSLVGRCLRMSPSGFWIGPCKRHAMYLYYAEHGTWDAAAPCNDRSVLQHSELCFYWNDPLDRFVAFQALQSSNSFVWTLEGRGKGGRDAPVPLQALRALTTIHARGKLGPGLARMNPGQVPTTIDNLPLLNLFSTARCEPSLTFEDLEASKTPTSTFQEFPARQ